MRSMPWMVGLAGAAGVVLGGVANAQPVPDYDFDWATIGDPGNRPATIDEAPALHGYPIGAVDHAFRISRTVVTVGQWLEFLNAYEPFVQGNKGTVVLTGTKITWSASDGYQPIAPGLERFPTDASFYNAGRYVNWLHNGKVAQAWAFDHGAYDATTFGTVDDDGFTLDQVTRNPDARFWIPDLNEWTKAFHYDPDRYGPGQEGYWLMPDSGDEPLISGLPEDGGETNAGDGIPELPVGSYPDVQSPWSLLDASGGNEEWTETVDRDPTRSPSRWVVGSSWFIPDYEVWDRLDFFTAFPSDTFGVSFRIASVVPTPPSVFFGVGGLCMLSRRRRY